MGGTNIIAVVHERDGVGAYLKALQAMVILFLAASGDAFGNVTVRTPFSIDALISSS